MSLTFRHFLPSHFPRVVIVVGHVSRLRREGCLLSHLPFFTGRSVEIARPHFHVSFLVPEVFFYLNSVGLVLVSSLEVGIITDSLGRLKWVIVSSLFESLRIRKARNSLKTRRIRLI